MPFNRSLTINYLLALALTTLKPALSTARNCGRVYDSLYGQMVYTNPQKMPQFGSEGYSRFSDYFLHSFASNDTTYWESRIKLEFIIDTNGRVRAARIYGKLRADWSVKEKDAIKLLNNMPPWQPGYCNGKKVTTEIAHTITCCYR